MTRSTGTGGVSAAGRSIFGVDGRWTGGGTTDEGRSGRSRTSGALMLSAGAGSTGGGCCGGATAGAGADGWLGAARDARFGGGADAADGAGGVVATFGAFCSFDSAKRFISTAPSRLDSIPGARISPVPVTDDNGRSRTPSGRDADSPSDDEDGSPDVLPNRMTRKICTSTDRMTNRPSAGSSVGLPAMAASGDQRYLVTSRGGMNQKKMNYARSLPHRRGLSAAASRPRCL